MEAALDAIKTQLEKIDRAQEEQATRMEAVEARLQQPEANPNLDPRPRQEERGRENRALPPLVHELKRHMHRH
ncbi:unnamed protein product [Linum trigynum]|uniref:Uncharacterized protein n=1 Tax=Linum trigynum TaxID=586398 RepID=A0AAV2GPH1_9ROSI